jgi:hypothetical protein
MAISATHYVIIRTMFEHGVLPRNGALLELGEANWYDADSWPTLAEDIKRYVEDRLRRDALLARLAQIVEKRERQFRFEIAKVYYELFFAPTVLQAIDFHGTNVAKKLDLNEPVVLDRRFDVVINNGTAEHIFNVAQVFKTVHEYTLPGGMMIHESPFTGWVDHGFYSLQPTLFFDLAEFNGYRIACMVIQDLSNQTITQVVSRDDLYELTRTKKLPENSMLLTAFKKDDEDRPFATPAQGFYRGALSPKGMAAWEQLR